MLKSGFRAGPMPRSARGFTLVELAVGLAIIGIMVALGLPSIVTMFQNSRLSSTALGYYNGIQTARTEAIRRNLPVEFMLTATPVDTIASNASATETLNGPNWIIRVRNPDGTFSLVDKKAGLEGAAQSGGTPAVRITGAATGVVPFTGTVTFNGFGGTFDGGAFAYTIDNLAGGACAPAGPMRCKTIQVPAGGQVFLCDPAAPAGDSRRCL